MQTLNVEIVGNSASDLELALEEVLKLVAEGNLAGFASNETGRFNFTISGEPEPEQTEA